MMPQLSSASLALLFGSTGLLLLACDEGASTGSNPSAGASSGGSATVNAGTTGAGLGGQQTTGGVVGQAGSVTAAGAAGTGTGGGSGSGGTASAGAAGTAGASGGPGGCSGALFCDDFEAYTDKPAGLWTTSVANGTVSIDTALHRSGTKSAKFTVMGTQAFRKAWMILAQPFPVANNAFYGRMMIYNTKAANDGVHWTMIQGEGAGTGGITDAKVRYGGQHQQTLMANYDSTGKASDCWQHSQTKMPEGKWACMEWYFEGATNTQKFWLDGKAVDDLTVVGQGQGCVAQGTEGKWLFPTFQRLLLGWESYQADDAREVWIDDVAVGTTQIGCPQ